MPSEPTPIAAETESSETSLRIMEAAAQVFLEKGYTKGTTRAIAAAAGINEVTLFRLFDSKIKLFEAVIERYSALPGLQNLLGNELTGDYHEDLLKLANHFLSGVARQRNMMRLVMCEANHIPELREVIMQTPLQMNKLLTTYFQQQIESGMVRPSLDPQVAAQAFFGIVISHGMNHKAFDVGKLIHEIPAESVVQQLVDIFAQGTLQS